MWARHRSPLIVAVARASDKGSRIKNHVVAALYRFVRLDDYADLREPLLRHCDEAGIKGTLLLAHEGINGTIAGPRAGIDSVIAWLRSDPRLADLNGKSRITAIRRSIV